MIYCKLNENSRLEWLRDEKHVSLFINNMYHVLTD